MPGKSISGKSVLPLNPIYKIVLVCLVLVPLAAAKDRNYKDWNYEDTRSDAREFAAGGFVHVRFSVGDLHIKRGNTDKISLHYTIKSRREKNLKEATVDFNVRDKDATIEFHSPSSSNTQFDVEMEVPQNTNLDVHAKVGDVTVDDVEGDKDLSLGVGDIRVGKGPTGYRLVNASTGIGDVRGESYGETSGWLGKKLKYHGEGKYELRAHVGVGDIHLEGN
jgi:hypothetical protein